MADEILTGSGGGGDILVAEVQSKYAQLSLADRASLRNHPTLVNLGPNLIGSGTEQISIFGLDGSDLMTARTEIQAISNQAFSVSSVTCTPAPYRIAYDYSDQIGALDPSGVVNSYRLAQSIVGSATMTLTNLIAQAIDGFTAVGTTGVDFTHDTFLAGQFALDQASVNGPYLCVLHPKQFTDWQSDLETRGGVTQWRPATAEMQMLRGQGYKGMYNNIDIFVSSKVQPDGGGSTDWYGGLFGAGAVAYKEMALGPAPRSQIVLLDVEGVIRVAESRNELSGDTQVVGHYFVGACNPEASRGRTLISAQ